MEPAPICIHGWDEANHYWAATRDGEPSFQDVQDTGDAIAAAMTRDCDLVMSNEVWDDMNYGHPFPRPSYVLRESS